MWPLVRLLRKLQLPKGGTFVDLGCGKGRVLMIASQFGFQRIVGVEFCAQLCRRARENVELFRRRYPSYSPIEIIESDVTHYEFRGDEIIFFLYNPFTSVVLAQLLENIARSVISAPRDIWLIYNTPLHRATIEGDGRFAHRQKFEIGGTDFFVYSQFNPARQSKGLPPSAEEKHLAEKDLL